MTDNNFDHLSEEQYHVLCEHGTEHAFTSPLNNEKRNGVYACAGCGEKLFLSDHKYDSGSGWPSFYQPVDGTDSSKLGINQDNRYGMIRTEIHCARCGGHLGHIFPDGPKPTGLRYCINGVALDFKPEE